MQFRMAIRAKNFAFLYLLHNEAEGLLLRHGDIDAKQFRRGVFVVELKASGVLLPAIPASGILLDAIYHGSDFASGYLLALALLPAVFLKVVPALQCHAFTS